MVLPETRTGALRDGPCRPRASLLAAPAGRPSFGRRTLALSCVLHALALFSLLASGVGLGGEDRPETVIEVDFVAPPAADPEPLPLAEPEPPAPEPAPPPPEPAPPPPEPAPPPPEPAPPPPEPAPPPPEPPPPPPEPQAPPPPEVKPQPPAQKAKPPVRARHAPKAPPAPVVVSAPVAPQVSALPREAGLLPLPDESLAAYRRLVWARIERRKPRDIHVSGTATVTFAIAADGSLLSGRLSGPSGLESLDRAALEALAAAAPFPVPPPGAAPAQLVFSIPFQFR